MPFVATTVQYPAAGKAAESRAILEERVRVLQAAGFEANLSAESWGPDYPAFRVGQRFATLADFENTRTERADPTLAVRLGPLSRRPMQTVLSETLQRVNQTGAPTKWSQFTVSAPALGKAAEVRALMLERGRELEAAGRRTTLSVQVAGPESGVFTRVISCVSLAELEEIRARAAADETYQAYVRKITALTSRPAQTSIRETLIPYPQR